MAISPEVEKLPAVISLYKTSGLLPELLRDTFLPGDHQPRDLVVDAARLTEAHPVTIFGTEYIPKQGGALLVFNHPHIDILFQAMHGLAAANFEANQRADITFVMGAGTFPLTFLGLDRVFRADLVVRRFARLYPDNVILVPTRRSQANYRGKRHQIREAVLEQLQAGKLVVLSPEAKVERDNAIFPETVYRHGSGWLAKQTSGLGIPIVPVGIWAEPENNVQVAIGKAFTVNSVLPDHEVAKELMAHVAPLLPASLRGPFRD